MPRPKSTDERRRLTEQFRRRRVSVFKAATQIYLECGVESFILFRRNGVFYTFKATEDESWPPSREEVTSNILPKYTRTLADYKDMIKLKPKERLKIKKKVDLKVHQVVKSQGVKSQDYLESLGIVLQPPPQLPLGYGMGTMFNPAMGAYGWATPQPIYLPSQGWHTYPMGTH